MAGRRLAWSLRNALTMKRPTSPVALVGTSAANRALMGETKRVDKDERGLVNNTHRVPS